jgi:hypothetical protein
MNTWNISGEVIKWGTKGSEQYPKLWIYVQLSCPKHSNIQDNKVFINFDIDPNTSTKKGKVAELIKSKLNTNSFIFISDAMITMISSSKKVGDTWQKEEMPGVKAKIDNICLSSTRFEICNIGLLKGPVTSYSNDETSNTYKMIVEERYRNPVTNEWKSRSIPILGLSTPNQQNLTGKLVFVNGMLCGTTPDGGSKTFGWAEHLIVYE